MIKLPKASVQGRFKIENVCPETGKRTPLSGWSDNIVLTAGKEVFATRNDWFNYCQVGTDDTTPAITQDALLGWSAGTSNALPAEQVTGNSGSAPYFGFRRKVFRFIPGELTDNQLNEVAIGWGDGAASATEIATRGLIVDINGDRSSPTPDPTEYMDVTYEIQYIVPTDSVTGQVVVDGTTYDYIVKAAKAGSTDWASYIGDQMGVIGGVVSEWSVYDGDIGASIVDGPTGNWANNDNIANFTNNTYVPGTYTVEMVINCGPTGWNVGSPPTTGGIRSMLAYTKCGVWQFQFEATGTGDPGDTIPKTSLYTMQLQLDVTFDNTTAL